MSSKRKFYSTIIQFEVLSEDPIPPEMQINSIYDEARGEGGSYVMGDESRYESQMDGCLAASRLARFGSDSGFFQLTEAGEDDEEYRAMHGDDDDSEPTDPDDRAPCSKCGTSIGDAEHDDNGGLCEECAGCGSGHDDDSDAFGAENGDGPNTNCLKGMRCPKCGSYGPFMIDGSACFEVSDQGTEDYEDVEWSDDSCCSCRECGRFGRVKDFKAQEDQNG